MGTSIELTVGGITLDWSKNGMGADYGFLFQEGDRTRRRSDQISYEYFEEHPEEDLTAHEAAFVRPLARVLPRLNLIGGTLDAACAEYDEVLKQSLELLGLDRTVEASRQPMTFEEFCAFACSHPLVNLDDTYVKYGEDGYDQRVKGRFAEDEKDIERIPNAGFSNEYWSECSYFGNMVCILSPYSMLQIFGLNPANAQAEVVWQYGAIVESGWVDEEAFEPGVRRGQAILVATEGTSDARIIKHALDLLEPDVADFFRFIDANERHPFWGTGNLVKFAEGLVRIDVQNQVIFLLDNDAEGLDAYLRLRQLGMPGNMRAMILPNLEAFQEFRARGPEGLRTCDINGRAAAIECYLDLNLPGYPPAQVLWTNYKKEVDTWQGALEYKETYMRRFLDQVSGTLDKSGYDTSKLEMVLHALLAEATILAVGDITV